MTELTNLELWRLAVASQGWLIVSPWVGDDASWRRIDAHCAEIAAITKSGSKWFVSANSKVLAGSESVAGLQDLMSKVDAALKSLGYILADEEVNRISRDWKSPATLTELHREIVENDLAEVQSRGSRASFAMAGGCVGGSSESTVGPMSAGDTGVGSCQQSEAAENASQLPVLVLYYPPGNLVAEQAAQTIAADATRVLGRTVLAIPNKVVRDLAKA